MIHDPTGPVSRELFDFVCAQRDEYAEKLEAEKLDRLQSTQSMYVEQLRLSGEINTLTVNYKDLQSKCLELEALVASGFTVITNSQPINSLNADHREQYWIAMQQYIDKCHALGVAYPKGGSQ